MPGNLRARIQRWKHPLNLPLSHRLFLKSVLNIFKTTVKFDIILMFRYNKQLEYVTNFLK